MEAALNSGSVVAVLVGVGALVLAVAVLFLGAVGGRTQVEFAANATPIGGIPAPPSDGEYGVVMATYISDSGLEVLGFEFGRTRREVNVAVVPPPGCDTDGGELRAEGACEDAPLTGEVSGGGTTAEGVPFVFITKEISEACYEVLHPGDPWPSQRPECRD